MRDDNLAAEEAALFDGVGLIGVSTADWLVVRGADRVAFLQGMLTNDLRPLQPGQGCRAAWLNAKAKVQAIMDVLAGDHDYWLRLPRGIGASFAAAIDRYVIMEDVTFEAAPPMTGIALAGPRAGAVVTALTGLPIASVDPMSRFPGSLAHCEAAVEGLTVRVVGRPASSAGGLELWAASEHGDALRGRVEAAGRPLGLLAVSENAAEVARISAGDLRWGAEVDADTFMPELPIADWVSFDKGCYLGQEPVARVHFRGRPNRQFVGLVLSGDSQPPQAGSALAVDEKHIGRLTSVARSARMAQTVALGHVRREVLEPGTVLTVTDTPEPVTAEVRELPLVFP